MAQASSTIPIHAPADAIWQVIGDLATVCQYLAMVVNGTVEGAGIGALCTLTSTDGTMRSSSAWAPLDEPLV